MRAGLLRDVHQAATQPHNEELQKARAGNVGEIRTWGGRKFQKQQGGGWKPVAKTKPEANETKKVGTLSHDEHRVLSGVPSTGHTGNISTIKVEDLEHHESLRKKGYFEHTKKPNDPRDMHYGYKITDKGNKHLNEQHKGTLKEIHEHLHNAAGHRGDVADFNRRMERSEDFADNADHAANEDSYRHMTSGVEKAHEAAKKLPQDHPVRKALDEQTSSGDLKDPEQIVGEWHKGGYGKTKRLVEKHLKKD